MKISLKAYIIILIFVLYHCEDYKAVIVTEADNKDNVTLIGKLCKAIVGEDGFKPTDYTAKLNILFVSAELHYFNCSGKVTHDKPELKGCSNEHNVQTEKTVYRFIYITDRQMGLLDKYEIKNLGVKDVNSSRFLCLKDASDDPIMGKFAGAENDFMKGGRYLSKRRLKQN
jgi:hypothetical protein